MALHSTQTSTVYPSIHFGKSQDTLQPILVSVCFSGTLPKHLVQSSVVSMQSKKLFTMLLTLELLFQPLRISVSLSEEFSAFTTPIINEIFELEECSTKGSDSDSVSPVTSPAYLYWMAYPTCRTQRGLRMRFFWRICISRSCRFPLILARLPQVTGWPSAVAYSIGSSPFHNISRISPGALNCSGLPSSLQILNFHMVVGAFGTRGSCPLGRLLRVG
jgi:hypothetical protein